MNKILRFDQGQIILISLLLLLVLLLFIPVGIFFIHDKNTPLNDTTNRGFERVAEHAFEQGCRKISETPSCARAVMQGAPIPGFSADTAYVFSEDALAGSYAVRISSDPSAEQGIAVTVYVKINQDPRVRGYRARYRPGPTRGALNCQTVNLKNNILVHWGPVYARRRIDAGWELFPRKYSNGEMLNRDKNGMEEPNSDGAEWWSYAHFPGEAAYDFDAIKKLARRGGTYYAQPDVVLENFIEPESRYYFFERNVRLKGRIFLKGVVIVKGNLELDCQDAGLATVYVPARAWQEYGLLDTSASDEYPADAGYRKNTLTYEFNQSRPLALDGFVSVGGDLIAKGNHVMYGALNLQGDLLSSGTFSLYYNDRLSVPMRAPAYQRIATEEFSAEWPRP